jgi:phage portal protein BeeE
MVLDGGKKLTVNGYSAVEMDFTNSQVLYSREMSIAYGVPPEKIGDSANKTYSNSVEANKEYAHDTAIPLLDLLYDEHNLKLGRKFKKCIIKYDIEQVHGLKGDQTAQYTTLNAANFLTVNEKRAILGYDDIGESGDVILMPMGLAPLNDVADSLDKPPME